MRRQAERAQLLLVPLGVGAGGEEEDDLARPSPRPRRRARCRRRATCFASPRRQCSSDARVALLVRDEQLDRGPEDRIGEAARRLERLELVPEVAREEVVHDREHLGPRAVVLRQREDAARLRAPLAEDPDVGVPEAVDRLELVPDEEQLVDRLARRPARRSTSSHWSRFVSWNSSTMIERKRHCSLRAHRLVVAQQVAREQLEVLEVERRLRVLRGAVGARERARAAPGAGRGRAARARRAPPPRRRLRASS